MSSTPNNLAKLIFFGCHLCIFLAGIFAALVGGISALLACVLGFICVFGIHMLYLKSMKTRSSPTVASQRKPIYHISELPITIELRPGYDHIVNVAGFSFTVSDLGTKMVEIRKNERY